MTDDLDDMDALFGTAAPSPPPPAPMAARPSEEHRRETRVRANWPARVLLAGDRIVELNVFDLSESGIGLVSPVGLPANAVLQVALAVPGLNEPTRITPVTGSIKTAHMTVRGHDIHCGGLWVQISAEGSDLINQWVRRLRK